jgi:eukaryotic-like serine/threonine-protein kinase
MPNTPPSAPLHMTSPIALSDWPRLLSLVEQGTQVPAAERERWLQGLALPAPLAQALRGLLQERQAIDALNFLTALPAVVDVGDLANAEAPGRFTPGGLIGPWRLLREVGQGGMSVVWLAECADGQLKRQVALKLPHAGPGQELLAKRMRRERKILAALEHPHIARLYDVGVTDAGTPYLVMEFVEGDNLLAYADAQHLGIHQRLLLFRQVLDAVQYAHGQLVLHRDLKPDNILVNALGHVKLLDFGIAKVMAGEGSSHDSTALTRATHRQLTPNYASPEQLQSQPMGTASDVYALGVVLYELLCGSRPHGVVGGSLAQLEAAILNNDPQPPSRRVVNMSALTARATTSQALAKTLRGDLDAIVLKALAKAPEQRYASADALSSDISRWQTGDTVTARSPGAWYYLSKFVQRHRWAVGLGGLATLALISAAAVALVQGQLAKQEALRAASARDFLLELFQESSPDRMKGVEVTARQLLEQGRSKAHFQLGTQTQLQGELLLGIGRTQYQMGDTRSAEDALQQAALAFRASGNAAGEASAYLAHMDVAFEDRAFDTVDALLRNLEPVLPAVKADPTLQLQWLLATGRQLNSAGNPAKARERLAQVLAKSHINNPAQQAIAFHAHIELREILNRLGDYDAANDHRTAAAQMPTSASTLSVGEQAFQLAMSDIREAWRRDRTGPLIKRLPEIIAACAAEMGYSC